MQTVHKKNHVVVKSSKHQTMILKLKSHSNREETYSARGPSRVHYIKEKESIERKRVCED